MKTRTTSAIAFYNRESKKDRNGYAPLEVSISVNGERKFLNLPQRFKPSEFNRKRPPQEIIEALDAWRTRINSYTTQLLKNGIPLTTSNLRDTIRTGGVKSYTCGQLFRDYLSILSKRVGTDLTQQVYRKYEIVAERFLKYIDKDKEVSCIDNALMRTIVADWRSKYDASTTCGYWTKLKTFIRFAIDNGHLTKNPCAGIKVIKPVKPIQYLNEEELNLLINARFEENRLQKALDCFLIMCSSGMSYADLSNFVRTDLQKEGEVYFVSKKRVKTGHTFTAIVLPFGVPIIQRYFTLPVISNQKYNKYLKEVGAALGIKKNLTTHMGRRTYATYLANRNVSLDAVAAALGDNEKIASQYYAKVFESTIIKKLSAAIG